ncbi:hypothetical protein [uncultured Aquimarina sp.]|uniref:hypothetical protein n=1 Tax=uncultured Aquimarina sp. TaxID=575652 RepID=UPI002623E662|nr:hypothetical protein [uncultured Aquimarina sp.]
METLHRINSLKKTILIIVFLLFGSLTISLYAQSNTKLPDYLITKYTGVLTSTNIKTKVNTNVSCTIKTRGYKTYAFHFSDGISPITSVKFMKNGDTYTSTIIYKGKTSVVSLNEEGNLSIGATSKGALAFSGSIENDGWDEDDDFSENIITETGNNSIHLSTGSTGIYMNGNQTHIGTENASIHTSNGSVSVGTGDNGILIENGNISLGTGNTEIAINSNNENHNGNCIINHDHNYGNLISCGSTEISTLPKNIVGIYRGKLKTYGTETRKGICTVVKTGCKTYRLDFSDSVLSIHDVQFGRKNDFDEYTSVIVEGEYSSAIEIDMTFDDLEIDGKILRVSFDGKRN